MDNFLVGNKVQYTTFQLSEDPGFSFGSNDGMLLSIPWNNGTTYGAQIAFDDVTSGRVAVRGKTNDSWGAWKTLIHSGNIGSQSVNYATSAGSATTLSGLTASVSELNYVDGVTSNVQTQLNNKLSRSGGIITGKIDLSTAPDANNDQAMGITNGASGGIHFRKVGTSNEGNAITWSYNETDHAHAGIYVKSSGDYGTKMYLATTNLFNDGAKAALEIDHLGNIKALRSKFVGALNGNADTATKATQDASGNIITSTYATKAELSTVATSGSYNDLSNKPTIPTKTSQLTNDSGFTSTTYVDNAVSNAVLSAGGMLWLGSFDIYALSNNANVTNLISYNLFQ